MGRLLRLLSALAVLCSTVAEHKARADWRFYEEQGFALDAAFMGGMGFFASPGAQFGAGTYQPDSNQPISKDLLWLEGFIIPALKASFASSNTGEFYGVISAVGAVTRGDGDAGLVSSTWGNPSHIGIEDAFVGWRSVA